MKTDCCSDHKYSLGSRLPLSTLALSVNSDTEWEMQVLRWKTMEQASCGSRPSDKGMGGGGAGSEKIFRPFEPQVGLRIRGTRGPLGPSPGSATAGYRKTGTCLLKLSAN